MKKLIPMLLAGLAIYAGGCTETVNTSEGRAGVAEDTRVVTDGATHNMARFICVKQARTPDGLLKVQHEITNTTGTSKSFYYMYEWFDRDGMQVLPAIPGTWIQQQIIGGESRMITGIAPKPSVEGYRLKVKRD